ncbi:GcvT family protein [Roseobacter litoralis]|uniref:Glycine-cleavage T protein with oxidoreductase activity (FAD-dependent) n=1 Tax=Roseobacter litoralis (strain ATCC 49566 / DSM 6996 / JCM 21268 / NBRC 15278 / OCh 149) TaxID=391595 RepID=F7ZHH5_ROSLO|nr:FAD-dependent oxidoreductase [Roseobacter litoralis]AEI92386.1 putative glycine-cleavage T protein with oxidoreductase activity (FAD-dependent) [Roseobacter litoralis Och 149]
MTPSELPAHASVVVIGGGIMGCSTLYHLAKMGVTDAILLERNKLTSGTTWHSAAQVRALRHSRNLTRMIQYSVDLYAQLEKETGQNVGWIQKGSLSIATTPDRAIHVRRQEALAHAFGIKADWVSAGEAQERWPLMNASDVLGAVWSPEDGRVSPSDVCAALVKSAKSHGAGIFENTGVTGILTKNGRITGVETTKGTVSCDAVALCAGLWSREIGGMAGAEVPALACEHFYLLTKPLEGIEGNVPTLSDHDNHLYIRDDSGGLLVGCFEPMGKPIAPGVLDQNFEFGLLPEDWDHFEPMMLNALHRLPCLETAEVKMLLNGPESFTPDGMFMLGETAETRGLFLGCGMNSVGMASGGGAGMNLAHCIVHGHTAYDLGEADAKRFAPVFNSVDHLMARAPEILGTHYEIAYPGRQLKTARDLRVLPLHAEYAKANAHFGQVYGWERPLYFGKSADPKMTFGRPDWFENVRREVHAAHEAAAVFDASPFGKIEVTGPDACAFLQHLAMRNMDRPAGTAIYTPLLNERGTYESDITAHRIADDHYRLFVGTNAIKRDLAWALRQSDGFDVTLKDSTEDYAVLCLMGPEAARIVAATGAPELCDLGYFKVGPAFIAGKHVRAVRMSYVGEAGWEITCKAENAQAIYAAFQSAGAVPAGLFAQSSMRIEKGFAAMGHELDGDLSPVEVGMHGMAKKTGGFIGAQALAERVQTSKRSLVTIVFDDETAVPLGHEPVYAGPDIIGQITSASFGYRIGAPVALAHVNATVDGGAVEIDIAGTKYTGRMQFAAAFDPSGARMRP